MLCNATPFSENWGWKNIDFFLNRSKTFITDPIDNFHSISDKSNKTSKQEFINAWKLTFQNAWKERLHNLRSNPQNLGHGDTIWSLSGTSGICKSKVIHISIKNKFYFQIMSFFNLDTL